MANNFAATTTAAVAEATSFDQAPPHSFVIELDAEHFAALNAHALACGTNPSALVALWIKPHLRDLCLHRPHHKRFSGGAGWQGSILPATIRIVTSHCR
jgi:hypothetical protein